MRLETSFFSSFLFPAALFGSDGTVASLYRFLRRPPQGNSGVQRTNFIILHQALKKRNTEADFYQGNRLRIESPLLNNRHCIIETPSTALSFASQ